MSAAAETLWLPLGELLVKHGLLSQRQLELALAEQHRTGRKLGEVLVGFGFVSEQALSATLLQQVGLAAEPEPEVEPEPESEPELAPVPAPVVNEEPRRAGHLAEAEEEPRPVVVRVEDLGHLSERNARVAQLEALVGDFERRSAEIQSRIAEVRGVLAELKS
jgi:hypothetical protein